jgi:hypothetical protein
MRVTVTWFGPVSYSIAEKSVHPIGTRIMTRYRSPFGMNFTHTDTNTK